MGVNARGSPGDQRWDPAKGEGRVADHPGDYHDAIHVKFNTVVLFLASLWGGLAPDAVGYMRDLRTRAVKVVDRTAYTLQELRGAKPGSRYLRHWCERLSAAVVMADARRCLKRKDELRARLATARRQRAATRRHATAQAAAGAGADAAVS